MPEQRVRKQTGAGSGGGVGVPLAPSATSTGVIGINRFAKQNG